MARWSSPSSKSSTILKSELYKFCSMMVIQKAMFLSIFHEGQDSRNSSESMETVRYLKNDAVIVYPTDTGYSIGCALFSEKATDRVTQIQLRPADKPYTVMCSDIEMVREYA